MKCLTVFVLILVSSGCQKSEKTRNITDIQWVTQTSGTSASFRGISAVSSTLAWASGSQGTYSLTSDGGATWFSYTVPNATSLDFRDVHAVDANVAYLISAGTPAKIYKTIDAGKHWAEQYSNDNPEVFYDAMAFWDAENGIAFSDPVDGSFLIIKTTDGGKTWNRVPPENIPPSLPGEAGFAASGTCLTVQGDSNVWFGTGGSAARVFCSTDRGDTWTTAETPIHSGSPSTGIFSLAFRDAKHGVAVGGDYRNPQETKNNAAITTDGGVTWILTEESPPAGFRSCVAYIPHTNPPVLVSVGTSGSDISFDDGWTWTSLDTVGYHAIGFTKSGDTGWAVGGEGRIAKLIY